MDNEINICVTMHLPAKKGALDGAFVVNVKCGTVLNFEVKRSVSDFIELDKRIRKRYPRSNLYKLILDTKPEGRKRAHSVCQPEDLKAFKSRKGMDGNFIYTQSNIATLEKEKMEELLASLTDYLQFMMTQHELLASDELLQFLDQEQNSMYVSEQKFAPPTIHEVLLSKIASRKVVVARSEEQIRSANCGQLLVWQFSTVKYDIGFSVEVNGEVKVPYTRYMSHEKLITGTLEINNSNSNNSNNNSSGGGAAYVTSSTPASISAAVFPVPPATVPSLPTSPAATSHSTSSTNASSMCVSVHNELSPIKKAILLGGALPASLTKAPPKPAAAIAAAITTAGNVVTAAPVMAHPSVVTAPKSTAVNCVLKWDNCYALLRNKELNYKVAVVEVADYENAKARALELERQHKQFELLRHTLKLELLRLAVTLSAGVHYSSSFEHEQAIITALKQTESARATQQLKQELGARETVERKHEELKQQLAEATREVQYYEEEYDATVQTLQEAEAATEAAEKARDAIFTSWKFAVSQLETAQAELKAARELNNEHEHERESMRLEIDSLKTEVQQLQSVHETEMLLLRTDKDMIISNLKQQLRQQESQPLTSPKAMKHKARFNKIFRKNVLQPVDANIVANPADSITAVKSKSPQKTSTQIREPPFALVLDTTSL